MNKVISASQKATRAQTKEHNKRFILKTIYERDPISRADLARLTKLTRASISNVVAALLEENLVHEVGLAKKSVGKPPTLLSFNKSARQLITLDLANDQFRGCLMNLRGDITDRVKISVEEQRGESAVDKVVELIEELKAKATEPLLGIGIGTPGVIEPYRGVVKSAINLNWSDLPLGDMLEERFDIPVYIANDAQLAALAQYLFSPDKESIKNLILVKVGRGIGSGIIFGGEIFFGDGFSAGEIGHVVVDPNGKLCTCGHNGCLETMASTRALSEQMTQIAMANPSSKLHDKARAGHPLHSNDILQAHQEKDFTVQPVIERSGRFLGGAIAHLVGAMNIRHIYIAGSMARFGDALLEPIRQEVFRRSYPALINQIDIEISDLGADIVVLGAAALVLNFELGIV
ncbi:ROK family protein [Sulfidibacter corallicola]|uniref:ROK family protein n=1 Tax=Sulfidibacter corallicola TaxID=2818388 RepID=A0A8A4TVG1_SULCO|nr:ROK family protein [Sulfidibacter corallicola]QTD53500.1 ROK family protein [Sulfidibacter corallicola]